MIELDRHIEILLLNNDCVIVPDFGGFMAHHVDARYDAEEGVFLPPLRTIGFNPQLKMNDSLLAQSYIEAYDLSYPEAIRRIENEVHELNQHLETAGSYELNDLGTLCLNKEGNIEFEPCEGGILTPSLYGLSSFEMKAIRSKVVEVTPVVEKPQDKKPASVQEVEKEQGITIKMSWLRNVAAVAAAIIAFFMIGTPISNSVIQESSFIHIGNQSGQSQIENQGDKQGISHVDATDTEAGAEKNNAEAGNKANAAQQNTSYCLVLASQVSIKNANNFINTLKEAGFEDARIYETSMVRVIFGQYATESEAYNALQQCRAKSRHFREAWVMKIED